MQYFVIAVVLAFIGVGILGYDSHPTPYMPKVIRTTQSIEPITVSDRNIVFLDEVSIGGTISYLQPRDKELVCGGARKTKLFQGTVRTCEYK